MNNLQSNLLLIIIVLITFRIIWVLIKGQNILGHFPINPFFFILSKILAITIILTPLYFGPISISFPLLLKIGKFLYGGGLILFLTSLYNLNITSITMGLPSQITQLQTNGLYKVSRNPIYVSIFIIFLGSILLSQHLIILVISIISIAIHHQIILKEEIFLASQFGPRWFDYKKRVKRYFLFF